jgi:HAD superfamily hydrolase (TIGR01509 family)
MVKALIFDFDGLLVNSEPSWDTAYDLFLMKHNVADKPEISNKMTGMGLVDAIRILKSELGINGDLDNLVMEYREMFYQIFLKEKNPLMFGAGDILEKAKEKRFAMAISSGGHTKEKLIEILKLNKIYDYFSVIVSSDDVALGKPAPDIYIESISLLELTPEECLGFEDSVNGVVSAKAAGLKVYGVNLDEKIRNDLINAGADRVFKNLAEVDL